MSYDSAFSLLAHRNETDVKNLNNISRKSSSIPYAGQGEPLQYLPPADPLGERFTHWFHHGWRYLYAPVPVWGERPDWQMVLRYEMDARALWRNYQHPDWLLGLCFDDFTNYLLIDLDARSQFHPHVDWEGYRSVLWALEAIGLCRPVAVRSSGNGGIHVYYFLSESVHTFTLACAVRAALWHAGIALEPGQVEQFPNCKPFDGWYKSHRLPMQEGSCLLDDDLEPCSTYLKTFLDATDSSADGQGLDPWCTDLEAFLDAADASAAGQDLERLQQAMRDVKSRKRRSGCTLGDTNGGWKTDLEKAIAEGWTGFHQTNQLLYRIATYVVVWMGLSGQAAIDWTVNAAVNAPGYRTWCRHQHEIVRRCTSWVRSCENFYSAYPSHPQRILSFREHFALAEREGANNVVAFMPNAERQRQTEIRLRDVVALLRADSVLPTAADERGKAIIAKSKEVYGIGFSQTTLHKPTYLPLWHPAHQPVELPCFPILPDPWETSLEMCVNPDPEPAYTRLSYMEVFCKPLLLLPPAVDVDLSSLKPGEVEIPPDPSIDFSNSSDSLSVENFLNENPSLIKLTYPYSSDRDAPSAHQQNLSMEQASLFVSLDLPQSPAPERAGSSPGCDPTSHFTTPIENPPAGDSKALPSEEELALRRRMLVEHAGPLLYQGPSAHTLVSIAGQKRMVVRGVRPGTQVVLCPDPWNLTPQLIFVKPLHGADDWLNGVQVRVDCLFPQPPPSAAQ